MSVEITHVRYSGHDKTHESIVQYKWRNQSSGSAGNADKHTMVDFIDNKKGEVYVGDGTSRVSVGTVHPSTGQPYLRTYADGNWTNNLLALPTF